jgi:putative transcriptional regulator
MSKRKDDRELGDLLLQSVREMKARKKARSTSVSVTWVVKVRRKTGLSQSQFAELVGVSVRTLQDWEQGRREPSGAARSLLRIADKHPEVFIELAA